MKSVLTIPCFTFIICSNVLAILIESDIEQELRKKFLDQTGFDKIPQFSKEEFESFRIPFDVKTKYDSLVWKHRSSNEDNFSMRGKRSSGGPSLSKLFNQVQNNSRVQGSFVYSSTFREKLRFDMEGRVPDKRRITMAQLRLFKKLPNMNRRRPGFSRSSISQLTDQQYPKPSSRWRYVPIHHARVSVFHTLVHGNGEEESKLIDSRMIMVNGSGWQSFDVTKAVQQWQKHPVKFMSITLELRIEGSRPGRAAAEIARMVRFTGQRSSSKSPRRPELVVFTEEEEFRTNDCPKKGSSRKCCRAKQYVDFREMAWTRHWIIEPTGYDAFRCAGRCRHSRRKNLQGTPRLCTVAESAPLAVMYLVKKDGVTRVQVTEFPNMIVEKCGCSLDSLYVV